MFGFLNKKKNIRLIEAQMNRMILLLVNTEKMQQRKMPDKSVIEDLQRAAFVFTICVVRPINKNKILLTQKIKCLNKELKTAFFIKFFMDKCTEISRLINFDSSKLDEIFNEQAFFRELAKKYESGELAFV